MEGFGVLEFATWRRTALRNGFTRDTHVGHLLKKKETYWMRPLSFRNCLVGQLAYANAVGAQYIFVNTWLNEC